MPEQAQDTMEFVRKMWGNMGIPLPGMVAPTFDAQDLSKRITNLKAVESWLRMNLSMLQMTIQNLEMQNATLNAVHAISGMAADFGGTVEASGESGEGASLGDALQQAALWPWNLMQQMQSHLQESAKEEAATAPEVKPEPARKARTASKSATKKQSAT